MDSSAARKEDGSAGGEQRSSPAAATAQAPASAPVSTTDPGLEALRVIRHDFKTPLTSLKMLAQIFKLGLEKGTLMSDPARTERNCRMLVDQVDKLVELADSLYEISVVQGGRLQLTRQLADLRPILTTAMTRFESKLRGVQMPDSPVWGEWDTAKLVQAFSYLFSEAESIELAMSTEKDKVKVQLKGDFKNVTEKTAPGRFIARAVIEKHNGALDGRFVVTLPTAPPQK